MNVNENIRRYRKEKNLTQQELAKRIGKSTISIRKYESGDINVPMNVLTEISEALEVPLHDLLGIKNSLINNSNKLDFNTITEILNDPNTNDDQKISSIGLFSNSKSIQLTRNIFRTYGYKIDLSCNPIVFIKDLKTDTDVARMTFDELERLSDTIELSVEGLIYKTLHDYKIVDNYKKFPTNESMDMLVKMGLAKHIKDNEILKENNVDTLVKLKTPKKGMHNKNKEDLDNGE